MNGEPYSTEILPRTIVLENSNGGDVRPVRLPVTWPELQIEAPPLIHLHEASTLRESPSTDPTEWPLIRLRRGEFLETCSYGILWLSALISFWCCFR
jgi:hypothetical protein